MECRCVLPVKTVPIKVYIPILYSISFFSWSTKPSCQTRVGTEIEAYSDGGGEGKGVFFNPPHPKDGEDDKDVTELEVGKKEKMAKKYMYFPNFALLNLGWGWGYILPLPHPDF